jgi:hypothetical protein
MRPSVRLVGLLVALLGVGLVVLVALPETAAAQFSPTPLNRQTTNGITARVGISPGAANQGLAPGTDRRALERALPELFETATAYNVRIETVSVGKGFYWEDNKVVTETDLDLIVSGPRDNVLAFAATLGQRWDQSLVFVWELRPSGEMYIASGQLLSGADKIDEATLQALGTELPDGGHLKFAGPDSLLVVANVALVDDEEFGERLGRAQRVLERAGIRTGSLTREWVTMYELNRENYQRFIAGATRSAPPAAPAPAAPAPSAPAPAASPAAAPAPAQRPAPAQIPR